jgi:hypothetical protein
MSQGLFIDAATGDAVLRDLTPNEEAALIEPEHEKNERLRTEAEARRRAAYTAESDPLYFGWQRGENTEQAWIDKVAEIRVRFPYAE